MLNRPNRTIFKVFAPYFTEPLYYGKISAYCIIWGNIEYSTTLIIRKFIAGEFIFQDPRFQNRIKSTFISHIFNIFVHLIYDTLIITKTTHQPKGERIHTPFSRVFLNNQYVTTKLFVVVII